MSSCLTRFSQNPLRMIRRTIYFVYFDYPPDCSLGMEGLVKLI